MKMEVVTSSDPSHPSRRRHHHHHHYYHHPNPSYSSAVVVPSNFYMSPSHLNTNTSGICYSVGENSSFHSSLPMMPLKSDGSLCIMEALTRSQQTQVMVPTSSPKLEDFLGGANATMGAHQEYGDNEREAMPLSLNSIYYSSNAEPETNRNHYSFDSLSDPFRQQHHSTYYSGLACYGMYQTPLLDEEEQTKEPQMGEENIAFFKNWVVPREYSSTQQILEQQQQVTSVSSIGNDDGGGASVGTVGCGELQSLSLSMSPGSQSSCIAAPSQISPSGTDSIDVV